MSSITDEQALERRLAAVERAVDGSTQELPDGTETDGEPVEDRLADLEQRVDDLDAALQAVRGFLGGVDAVNEEVETRANTAIAAVDRLERRLDAAGIDRDQRESDDQPEELGDSSVEDEQPESSREPDVQTEAEEENHTLRKRLRGQW